MDKEALIHIYNGIFSAVKRNKFESAELKWMNQEPVILSTVSQKEKNKYHILMHIYGI